jgi:hypothetical protein
MPERLSGDLKQNWSATGILTNFVYNPNNTKALYLAACLPIFWAYYRNVNGTLLLQLLTLAPSTDLSTLAAERFEPTIEALVFER